MATPRAIAWPDATAAQTTAPQTVDPVTRHVAEASRRFGIPQAWIWAVMRADSAGDVRAVSHAGAMRAMKIMPATWTYLRGRSGLGDVPYHVRIKHIPGNISPHEIL